MVHVYRPGAVWFWPDGYKGTFDNMPILLRYVVCRCGRRWEQHGKTGEWPVNAWKSIVILHNKDIPALQQVCLCQQVQHVGYVSIDEAEAVMDRARQQGAELQLSLGSGALKKRFMDIVRGMDLNDLINAEFQRKVDGL